MSVLVCRSLMLINRLNYGGSHDLDDLALSMTKNNKNSINNAHDQFFRTAMSNKQVAREFLRTWLPSELCQLVDFDQLEIQPRPQINDLRQESEVDVLFKTTIDGHEAYIYLLLEHQSTLDPLMPFRLLKYLCNIIDQHLKVHDKDKIPLIIY